MAAFHSVATSGDVLACFGWVLFGQFHLVGYTPAWLDQFRGVGFFSYWALVLIFGLGAVAASG